MKSTQTYTDIRQSTYSVVSQVVASILDDKHAVHNRSTLALALGQAASTLSRWLNMHDERSLPADLLVPICRELQTIEPIEFLASAVGNCVVVSLDEFREDGDVAGLVDMVLDSMQDAGAVAGTVKGAVADGVVTDDERIAMKRALWRVMQDMVALDRAVEVAWEESRRKRVGRRCGR